MSDHFNQLTPAETERLAWLSEELAEASQIIGKILRHGYASSNPFRPTEGTNRELLEKELGHVLAAIQTAEIAGDLVPTNLDRSAVEKLYTVQQWFHHQEPVSVPVTTDTDEPPTTSSSAAGVLLKAEGWEGLWFNDVLVCQQEAICFADVCRLAAEHLAPGTPIDVEVIHASESVQRWLATHMIFKASDTVDDVYERAWEY